MTRPLFVAGAILCVCTSLSAKPGLPFNKHEIFRHFFQVTFKGKVSSQSGENLQGVTITVKGAKVSTISGIDGTFNIQLPAGSTTLVFSYVGFEQQEVNVAGMGSVAVQLKPVEVSLSDVIVVGYGTQKKINLTGAVVAVTGAELNKRPSPNASNLLQGKVPGLQVTQPSAEPGRDNGTFLIRGKSTFGGSTAPLVLIDGVTGNINNLAPGDIENVVVLKDAASAAIYGSRAANGVILVTTKKGKKGNAVINYSVNVGRWTPTALPDLITNSAEYMTMYNTAAARSGVAFRYDAAEIAKYQNATDRNQYPNFDNIHYYFKSALVSNHNLSISGGTDKSAYNISIGYLNQDAMLPGYNYKKYNALLNYSSQVSKNITVGTVMNLTYKNAQEPPFTSENMALLVYASGPLYGPFLPDGSGRVVTRAYDKEGRNRNAQEALAMGWQNTKEYNLNAQVYADIKLFKRLTWSSKAAVNYVDQYNKMYQHPYQSYLLQVRDPATNDYQMSTLGPDLVGVTDTYVKNIQPTVYSTLTYDTKIASNHNLKVLVGYEQIYGRTQALRGRRLNGVSSSITEISGYTNTGESVNFSYPRLATLPAPAEYALQSGFGRVNYDYKGKYLLEGNIRYDGTSRVSPDYRWGVYPSVSAGWLASSEDFIRDKFSWINNLKLRASYGTLGNQEIGNYPYQNLLSLNVSYPFGNATPTPGAVLNTFHDQSIRWESTSIKDIGLDFDMKQGLFGFTFDWFRKNTYNILGAPLFPASIGLGAPVINNGKMHSEGIELELRHENHIGKVSYGLNANLSTANNKVDQIAIPSLGTTIRQVGQPYDAYYLYIWDGIFQTADVGNSKVPKHVANANIQPGDLKMKDLNGDGVVDGNDRQVVKGVYPDYIYSFGGHVDYKGFSMSFFFQGVQGIANRVNNWGVDPFMQGTAPTKKWENAWSPTNPSNTLPGIYIAGYTGVAAYAGSTYYLMDASYLRLKNLVFSYSFPESVYTRIKAKGLSFYVSGENLFTITKYEGSDPERASSTGNFSQYPQARILNAGLNIKF